MATTADKIDDRPKTKRDHLWGRILGALGLIAVGAGFITWGATTFQGSVTPEIPPQSPGDRNTVKIEVPQRVTPQGAVGIEPYFTTCSVTATYGYWESEPSLAELSAQPDDWPQEISAVLPLANPAYTPSPSSATAERTAFSRPLYGRPRAVS